VGDNKVYNLIARLVNIRSLVRFFGIIFTLGLAGCGRGDIKPVLIEYEAAGTNLTEPKELMAAYQQLLKEYITNNGRVEYEKLTAGEARAKLDGFLGWVEQVDIRELEKAPDYQDGRQAFYINAYNACVLRGVLEFYPFKRLTELEGDFYEDLLFLVAGERLSLSQIAQQCGRDADWRVALALGGPSRSEPTIARTLYTADNLHEQLDEAVKNYIGSCAGMRIDHVSQRILFGKPLYERKEIFIQNYYDRYNIKDVSLISALIPWSGPRTQEQLVELVGYGAARQKWDDRLNDAVNDEQDTRYEDKLNCGIK
jgi:hypothetical protein